MLLMPKEHKYSFQIQSKTRTVNILQNTNLEAGTLAQRYLSHQLLQLPLSIADGLNINPPAGTIYPGASGVSTPFGYMNIRYYIPHPKYDVAVIKGIKRDQDKFYQYYIKPFTTTVRGYSDEELSKFVDQEVYSYGYPYRNGVFKQYRSDGKVNNYSKYLPLLSTDIPAFEGQSGSGVFKKDGPFVGIIVSRARGNEAEVLPFSKEIATWINNNAK